MLRQWQGRPVAATTLSMTHVFAEIMTHVAAEKMTHVFAQSRLMCLLIVSHVLAESMNDVSAENMTDVFADNMALLTLWQHPCGSRMTRIISTGTDTL